MILLIGANPTDAHPVFGSRMKQRLREGAQLVVVDPRRIDLVRTPHIEAAAPPAAAARHQRRGRQRAGTRRRHRGAGRPRLRRRSLRGRLVRRLGGVHRPAGEQPGGDRVGDGRPGVRDPRRRPSLRDGAERSHLLRPRRHRAQPGLDDGHGHGQPRHGHRQHRPRRRRRQPAARSEQRAGLVRHGLVPARVQRLPARVRRHRPRAVRGRLGPRDARRPRAAHPEHVRRRGGRHLPRPVRAG